MNYIRSIKLPEGNSSALDRKLFLVGTAFFWISLYIYQPTLSPYAKYLSKSLAMVGLVAGSYGFTQLVFRFPLGIWSDKIGRRKPFVLSGFVLIFISCIGLAMSPNAWSLVLFRATAGVAASMWVAFTVMYSGYFKDNQAAKAMSMITFCVGLGQAIGAIGGKIADEYGWLAPFYSGAGLSVVGLLLMLPIKEKLKQNRKPASFKTLLAVASHRRLLIVSIITSLSQFAVFSTTYGFLTVYAEGIGASKSHMGLLIFVINACQTTAMLLSGTLIAPRLGYKATVGTAYFSIAGVCFVTPYIQNLRNLFIFQGAGALFRGLAYPLLMGMAIQGIRQEEKAAAMGFFQAVYAIGMFLGPAISGLIGNAVGLKGVFLCAGGVYILAALMGIAYLPKREIKQVL
ncbi:MFS transporter [Candidatus Poribacteria bacterium]|nr:MFS transporter [Candidatus Poribacteria bacterium]